MTEEIWQALPHDGETIVTASWPDPVEIPADPASVILHDAVVRLVSKVRNLRAHARLLPSAPVVISVAGQMPGELASVARIYIRGEVVFASTEQKAESEDFRSIDEAMRVAAMLDRAEILAVQEDSTLRDALERQLARYKMLWQQNKVSGQGFALKAKPEVKERELARLEEMRAQVSHAVRRYLDLGTVNSVGAGSDPVPRIEGTEIITELGGQTLAGVDMRITLVQFSVSRLPVSVGLAGAQNGGEIHCAPEAS